MKELSAPSSFLFRLMFFFRLAISLSFFMAACSPGYGLPAGQRLVQDQEPAPGCQEGQGRSDLRHQLAERGRASHRAKYRHKDLT